jgi:hypothetical protein
MKRRERAEALSWFIVSLAVLAVSYNLGIGHLNDPGPGFIPGAGALGLFLSSLMMFLSVSFHNKTDDVPQNPLWQNTSWLYPSLTAIVLCLYGVFLPVLGYLLATFVIMMIFLTMGRVKIYWGILASAITSVSTYIFFKICFAMPLPQGIPGY